MITVINALFAARSPPGPPRAPGSSSGALPSFLPSFLPLSLSLSLSLLSFRTVPFATADFCKNMPSCIFAVLQKRHFLQKIKLGEIP
ncbi:hypothetical protein HMPREF3036_01739 [Sutterella sp. KLE1602]|nr:hypothetical protein HMPREF3036_01739 [Sutterella sp. KLE1602]